jgi:steroid delta-isomerase-like uncharacterized protein
MSRLSFITLLSAFAVMLAASFGGAMRHTAAQEATPEPLPPLLAELQAAWNAHDPERYAALFTADGVVEYGFTDDVFARGRDQIANEFAAPVFATYPDVREESRGWYASGDLLIWKWTFTGSYTGQEPGLPPGTGQTVSFPGISIYEVRDGLIARKVFVTDDLAFMQSLGFELVLDEGVPAAATPPA